MMLQCIPTVVILTALTFCRNTHVSEIRDLECRFKRNAVACASLIALLWAQSSAFGAERPNVLFIIADDLRPQLGCYGEGQMVTPHIDRLASEGTLFQRAYCQQAICGPSRASFLTGLRPNTLGVSKNLVHFRNTSPDIVTMPQYFKNQGYQTVSIGKVFHDRDNRSWSEPEWVPEAKVAYPIYTDPEILGAQSEYKESGKGVPRDHTWWGQGWWTPVDTVEVSQSGEETLFDYRVADRATEKLEALASGERPFFLAVGFFLPHIPYIAPKRYWDLYPENSIKVPDLIQPPVDAPKVALTNSPSIWKYRDTPEDRVLTESMVRHLTRGYYASVSFMDAQVGRVVDTLERLGLEQDTIVVFIGDHGYHHGEQGTWSKHTNFEAATRTPLIVRTPDLGARGVDTNALVELVDIFPSLCELTGLPVPNGLDGRSFVSVLEDPSTEIRTAAFSQFPRGAVMGDSLRTDRFRYTEWARPGEPSSIETELYDHLRDPRETKNVSADPRYQKELEALRRLMESEKNN